MQPGPWYLAFSASTEKTADRDRLPEVFIGKRLIIQSHVCGDGGPAAYAPPPTPPPFCSQLG